MNGKIYSIGGRGSGGEVGFGALSSVNEYDPTTDTWTKKADMPTARWLISGAGCVIDGKIYIIGGVSENWEQFFSAVEVFDPAESQSINFRGKLPTTWGEVRTALNR